MLTTGIRAMAQSVRCHIRVSTRQMQPFLKIGRRINRNFSRYFSPLSTAKSGHFTQSDQDKIQTPVGSYLYVRSATPEDYLDVLALQDQDKTVYRHDRLAAQYNKLLRQSNLRISVGVLEGQVVACSMLLLGVDGGRTAVVVGRRERKDVTERGYPADMLLSTMDVGDLVQGTEMVADLPYTDDYKDTVHENRLVWNMDSFPLQQSRKRPSVHHIYSVEDPGFPEARPQDSFSGVMPLNAQQFCSIVRRPALTGYLFPSGRFVMDSLIGRPIPDNERFILERLDSFVGFVSTSLVKEVEPVGEKLDETDEVGLTGPEKAEGWRGKTLIDGEGNTQGLDGMVSYNTSQQVPAGYVNHVQLYGRPTSEADLRAHLRSHIRVMRRRQGHGVVKVSCEEEQLGAAYGETIRGVYEEEGIFCLNPAPERRMIANIDWRRKFKQWQIDPKLEFLQKCF